MDIAPEEMTLAGDELVVTWPDGHMSRFAGEDVRALEEDDAIRWRPWETGFLPRRTDFRSFVDDDRVAERMIADFLRDGVAILERAPREPGTLELLTPRLGPIREVLFARIHDVKVDQSGYNVAHTTLALPPHNDFASYTWPPSVQALHMLDNETAGGESFVVDGWNILEGLRADHPDLFEVLREVPVPFREFDDGVETHAVSPIVSCDVNGDIVGFRFSNQLMQAINPNRPSAGEFYRAYHELCARVTDPSKRVCFRLAAGEILVVAAHRVLHGREAFEPTGDRHLQDAYFELDNVRNHRVVLCRGLERS